MVISDASGTHIIGTGITFTRGTKGSCARASRLPARSVAEHARLHNVYAHNLLRQLYHPVPPSPQVSRSSFYVPSFSGVPCVDSSYRGMNHGGRRMEAQGHPPVQPPQAGYLPAYTPMPVIAATAIAPTPAVAPHAPMGMKFSDTHAHRQLVTPPPVFIDYQRY